MKKNIAGFVAFLMLLGHEKAFTMVSYAQKSRWFRDVRFFEQV